MVTKQVPEPNELPITDAALERLVAGCLIFRDDLIAHAHAKFGIDVVADFQAQAVIGAVANLRERGVRVEPDAVAAELRRRGCVDIEVWYPKLVELVPDVIDPLTFVNRTASIVRLAERRRVAIATANGPSPEAEAEAEVDEFALRDVDLMDNHKRRVVDGITIIDPVQEPSASTAPEQPADPWSANLAAALVDVKKALEASMAADDRPPLFESAEDLFTRPYPAVPWRVTNLISQGGLAQFGAEPKSCKTWFAVEVAVAVATGTLVCGEFTAQQGVVAYFFAEDLAVQVRNRLRALLAPRGLDHTALAGRLHVCPRGRFLDITRDEDLAWILASARRLGPIDLLVLDPLRDVHSAAENESDEMAPVMKRLRLLGELLGCTVAFAHHAGKPTKETRGRRPGQRSRGSSAIYGSTDSGIYFGLRDGDGVSRFELEVDVEIKGGRSAGHLDIVLEVQDDADGGAERATWTVSRETKAAKKPSARQHAADAKSAQQGADDDKVFAWVCELAKTGNRCSRTSLRNRDDRPLSEKKVTAALDRLIESGRFVLCDGAVSLPELPSRGGDS